jgi:hypothetical protein
MRSKGGIWKGSVLGCMKGLSAIAEVLAVPAAGAAAGVAASATAPRAAALSKMETTIRMPGFLGRRSKLQ